MNIYPAIDLQAGKCVRLYQGRFDKVTEYEDDPVMLAKSFVQQGASILHVVDLDGAKQESLRNLEIVTRMVKESGMKIQMGGGIRTRQNINEIINVGVFRVILGSIAVLDSCFVKDLLQEFGNERIVLAFDVYISNDNVPKAAVQGWQKSTSKSLWDLLDAYQDSSLKHVLCTDIQQDGTLKGPNINLYQQCARNYPAINFQASGGVHSLEDLRKLAAIPVSSVIVGKAIYEKKFSFSQALEELAKC